MSGNFTVMTPEIEKRLKALEAFYTSVTEALKSNDIETLEDFYYHVRTLTEEVEELTK